MHIAKQEEEEEERPHSVLQTEEKRRREKVDATCGCIWVSGCFRCWLRQVKISLTAPPALAPSLHLAYNRTVPHLVAA